ncbi:MAG: 50S ribosomal protein L18 [Deltaproteobacteria bacterium]|nr:50S ribosomal protein L18 [Deltaproteobacteria bacterium]
MLSYGRVQGRGRRQKRVRKKIQGTDTCPRVCVFRSNKHIYAQVISDEKGATLVSISTMSKDMKSAVAKDKGVEAAKKVGTQLAEACKGKGISNVIFDRNGFLFHGRVKALADAAREAGLKF